MTIKNQTNSFAQNLDETIEWCQPRVNIKDPKWCLRSKKLRPEANYFYDDEFSFTNSPDLIQNLITKRSKLLNLPRKKHPINLKQGRLLFCAYTWSGFDGQTRQVTNGFFDCEDNPPWDCWVHSFEDCLISWIPSPFVNSTHEAILCEAFGIFTWIDNPMLSTGKEAWEKLPKWIFDYCQSPTYWVGSNKTT